MLFNSYAFLLVFLPITVAVFFLLARVSRSLAAAWLALASLAFYAWWDYRYIALLLGSILFNYVCGRSLATRSGDGGGKVLLALAIGANLALLGYYKYANFFISSYAAMAGAPPMLLDIVLPIGISFYTFTQIAFLVDAYRGYAKEYRFVHYLLFVTYFPHLIAGPVLHHKEMMPQFAEPRIYAWSADNFSVGMTIFFIGLAKKVLVADNLAPHANFLFGDAGAPSLLIAWGGVLAYTFQLYFDFSGYSDMAIGISRLFGVRLPLNFASPYKAADIAEFWRCWHMTLSRFLRDYLYIALGGNRSGPARRYTNLMLTMLLGGLWHGAGWTFVIWGGLHGLYLIVFHAWRALRERFDLGSSRGPTSLVFSVALTFIVTCFAWVFFRATDLSSAWQIVKGMVGMHGIALPEALGLRLGTLRTAFESAGIGFYAGGGKRFFDTWLWVLLAAWLAFGCPNTQQILRHYQPALGFDANTDSASDRQGAWHPGLGGGVVFGALAVACLLSLSSPSEFLYFQF